MKISIIAVGKIKEKHFRDAIGEYSKRLGRYCKLDIIEVADEKTDSDMSSAQEDIIRKREADRIIKHIADDTYLITLEICGEALNSVQLSNKINKLGISGISNITFVIGGSIGLHDCVSNKADYKLSFSKMTFPHQLMRIILLEQIYRGYRIINNEPYHK